MGTPKQYIGRSALVLQLCFFVFWLGQAQTQIPAKYDGFLYNNRPASTDTVIIEAFMDPVCPDSRDSWPPLKQTLDYYAASVSFILHPFPLPYHDNSFLTSRALHIVNQLNASATYSLLEMFFQHQEKYYNKQTLNMSRASVVDHITKLVTNVVGSSHYSAVQSGFSDRTTDLATRVSFKYGCSRGVFGTPFFYVNGFLLSDGDSSIDYLKWRSIIDPLVGTNSQDLVHYLDDSI